VQKIDVVDSRPDLLHQIEQKAKLFLLFASPRWVEQKYSASPLAAEEKSHSNQRTKSLRIAQLREWSEVLDGYCVPLVIQRKRLPAIAVNRGITHRPGKIIQTGPGIAGTRFKPAELVWCRPAVLVQLSDKHPFCVCFLR